MALCEVRTSFAEEMEETDKARKLEGKKSAEEALIIVGATKFTAVKVLAPILGALVKMVQWCTDENGARLH